MILTVIEWFWSVFNSRWLENCTYTVRPRTVGGVVLKTETIAVAEISSAISKNAWFFPFNTKTFVTRPNCNPKFITSASLASFGMFLICITLDGLPEY